MSTSSLPIHISPWQVGFILVMTAAMLAGLRWTITQVLLQGGPGGGTLSPTGRGGGGSGDHQVLMLGVREGFLLEDEQLLRETSPLTPGGSRAWRGSATGGGNGRLRGGGKHVA